MTGLAAALRQSGGARAAVSSQALLSAALAAELAHGGRELGAPRSGYCAPVTVAVAASPQRLLAAVPVASAVVADPAAVGERGWLLAAASVGVLVELAGPPPLRARGDLELLAGATGRGFLLLAQPATTEPATVEELAPLAFEEQVHGVDRLRAVAVGVPAFLLEPGAASLRAPIGDAHPLRVAEAVARLGGRPADPAAVEELEDALMALVGAQASGARPHEDPDPSRRLARRILQRLDGSGKWGGYHTDFAHLSRGFAGNERARAAAVGECLIEAGLLVQKPSVGQRHVFLNPRRAGAIRRLIDSGELPEGLRLPG